MALGYQQVFALVLEHLKQKSQGQCLEILEGVVTSAIAKGLLPPSEARGLATDRVHTLTKPNSCAKRIGTAS